MYKKKILALCAVFSAVVLFPLSSESLTTDPKKLKYLPLDFNPPKTERVTLENGMILHLFEDHELPIISVHAFFKTGSAFEPEDKTGLASLTGTLMRTGGTVSKTVEEIDENLEYIAANVSIDFGFDKGNASLTVLKKDIDTGLEMWADMLMYPSFPQDKIEIEKNKEIESIRRENDSPHSIVSREFSKIVFNGSPQGRFPTVDSIKKISRDDLV
ncbi:MAG: M16 family metallopeptidase, partial [Nitrospinota bacterium]